MDVPTFGVSEFLAVLNQTLEMAYPVAIVEGEVASYKVSQGKYVFFDLKDEAGAVSCFMMLYQQRMPLEDGMKVLVRAQPRVTARGKFSLTVQAVRLVGEGTLRRSQELLKAKLTAEGLFDQARKRSLPTMPQRIAVISSPQAAGYADFIKIVNQRIGGLSIEVAPVQVQGDPAPAQIVRAIEYFNQQSQEADVLVLIRGGGSADDLAAFSDEAVVRAIAGSRIPTLVGVGHETDTTLADLAADVRAATPSNAAQLMVPDRRELIAAVRHQLLSMAASTERSIHQLIYDDRQKLSDALERASEAVELHQRELTTHMQALRAYDPAAVLARGYAIVRGTLKVGEQLKIDVAQKVITAEVIDVKTT